MFEGNLDRPGSHVWQLPLRTLKQRTQKQRNGNAGLWRPAAVQIELDCEDSGAVSRAALEDEQPPPHGPAQSRARGCLSGQVPTSSAPVTTERAAWAGAKQNISSFLAEG